MTYLNENPKLIFDNIKELLIEGVKDRQHPFHTPIFTNTNINNLGDSRIIVLRYFDPGKCILNFNTDFRSPKVKNLVQNKNSLFLFYDLNLKIQLRIKTISNVNNQNDTAKIMWDKTTLMGRKCYLTKKAPSSITSYPEDGIDLHLKGKEPTKTDSEIGYKNFTVIESKIVEIDWLNLAASGHRRLNIKLNNKKPSFDWIIP